jgi:hypothetical protein
MNGQITIGLLVGCGGGELTFAWLNIYCLLINFPLHYLVGLAAMQAYEIPGTTKLRIRVEAIAHSTMSHDLGNVGFMLTTETLLFDTKALTGFCECPRH